MSTLEITLGNHTLEVYAQRHAYLAHGLGKFVDQLSAGDMTSEKLLSFGQSTVYELLSVLVPGLEKRIPEYEFCGYASKAAMTAEDYDPKADKSPTMPEIVEAFEVISKVNRFNIFKNIEKIVDPTLLRAGVNTAIAKEVQGWTTSQSSPSENGASESTSSMTAPPT